MNLARSSAVSGAALDTSYSESIGAGVVERTFLSAVNLDLGLWLDNPSEDRAKLSCALQIVPGAHLIRLGSWYRDKGRRGCRILLTDGGHSENLGAFSIVRRFPDVLVVIDGEQDDEYRFPGYTRLRELLLRDLNLVLSIPDIDQGLARTKMVLTKAVFEGTVRSLPLEADESVDEISVIYVKIPPKEWVTARCDPKTRASLPDSICDRNRSNSKFPFAPTAGDQAYDREQFNAYRDLGWEVVRSGMLLIKQVVEGRGFAVAEESSD